MLNQVYQAEFSTQQNGSIVSQDKVDLSLDENGFSFLTKHSKARRLDFVEIKAYSIGNHQLELNLDNQNVYLRGFGRHFTEFTKDFRSVYNSFLGKVLFLNGHGEEHLFNCKATVNMSFSETIEFIDAELRLFEDRLSLVGDKYFTLHFSEIINTQFKRDTYQFDIHTPIASVKIYFLGRQTDLFLELFEKKLAAFTKLSITFASQLFGLSVKSLDFIREGRLVALDKVAEFGIKHWDSLLGKVLSEDMRQTTFTLLRDYQKNVKLYYGFKRKDAFTSINFTEPDLAGFIHWFVFDYGKIAAVEVVSDEGYATYFYNTSDGISKDSTSAFWHEQKVDTNIYLLNRAYILLNFNREPISLAKDAFSADKAKSYAYAIGRLDYLTNLRKKFVGKVGHYEKDQWEKQVNKIFQIADE